MDLVTAENFENFDDNMQIRFKVTPDENASIVPRRYFLVYFVNQRIIIVDQML